MNNGLIIAGVSIVLVLILLGVFVYSYLFFLRRDVLLMWEIIRIKLGVRLDKIPLLLEVAKSHGAEVAGASELIEARSKAWAESGFGVARVRAELLVSGKIKEVFAVVHKNEELKKDTVFLAQKEELRVVGEEIEGLSDSLNRKVRGYNVKVGFLLIRPLTRLMGFKKMPVFEFEP